MLQKIFKEILKRVLGEFLAEELDVDQLEVSLGDQKLTLNTLKINVDKLNAICLSMDLPLRLTKCVVGHFECHIPNLQRVPSEGYDVTIADVRVDAYLVQTREETFVPKSETGEETTAPASRAYVAGQGQGLDGLTYFVETLWNGINLTIVHLSVNLSSHTLGHTLQLEVPGITIYDKDAMNARKPGKQDNTESLGGKSNWSKGSTKVCEFLPFSVTIEELSEDRERVGVAHDELPTSFTLLRCGKDDEIADETSYFSVTIRKNDREERTIAIDCVFSSVHLIFPSKHGLIIASQFVHILSTNVPPPKETVAIVPSAKHLRREINLKLFNGCIEFYLAETRTCGSGDGVLTTVRCLQTTFSNLKFNASAGGDESRMKGSACMNDLLIVEHLVDRSRNGEFFEPFEVFTISRDITVSSTLNQGVPPPIINIELRNDHGQGRVDVKVGTCVCVVQMDMILLNRWTGYFLERENVSLLPLPSDSVPPSPVAIAIHLPKARVTIRATPSLDMAVQVDVPAFESYIRQWRGDSMVATLENLHIFIGGEISDQLEKNKTKVLYGHDADDVMAIVTFDTVEANRAGHFCDEVDLVTDAGVGNHSFLRGESGRLPSGPIVRPTIIVHNSQSSNSESIPHRSLGLHESVDVRSGQFRSFEPRRGDSDMGKTGVNEEDDGTFQRQQKRRSTLIRENAFVRAAQFLIEMSLPIAVLRCTEEAYARMMDLVDAIVVDNAGPAPVPKEDSEDLESGIYDDEDNPVCSFPKTVAAMVMQILRCEVHLSEIDLPAAMIDSKTGECSTIRVANSLGLQPTRVGTLKGNFFERAIETLRQRVYHAQAFCYHMTMSDFQLVQVSGTCLRFYPLSYLRLSVADMVLGEGPAQSINPCPVLYGTKWGDESKYATHVPFGSLQYGAMLWMTINTTSSRKGSNSSVDGDIYGATFRYNVTSSWLFRLVKLILSPRKNSASPVHDTTDNVDGENDIPEIPDTLTSVLVQFHDTVIDYIPVHVDTRVVLTLGTFQVSAKLSSSTRDTVFEFGAEDVSMLLRQSTVPYHCYESFCSALVHRIGNDEAAPDAARQSHTRLHPMAKGLSGAIEVTKLSVWDVERMLIDAGFVKVLDLNRVNVVLSEHATLMKPTTEGPNNRVPRLVAEADPLPLTDVLVDMGSLNLYSCADSFVKFIDTISMWWEEYGVSDPFLGKWIRRKNEPPLVHKGLPIETDAEQEDDTKSGIQENQDKTTDKMENLGQNKPINRLSVLSGLEEDAFVGVPSHVSNDGGSRTLKMSPEVNTISNVKPAKTKQKVVIFEDYYGRVSSPDSLESSFEILDFDGAESVVAQTMSSLNVAVESANTTTCADMPRNVSPALSVECTAKVSTVDANPVSIISIPREKSSDENSDGENESQSRKQEAALSTLSISWFGSSRKSFTPKTTKTESVELQDFSVVHGRSRPVSVTEEMPKDENGSSVLNIFLGRDVPVDASITTLNSVDCMSNTDEMAVGGRKSSVVEMGSSDAHSSDTHSSDDRSHECGYSTDGTTYLSADEDQSDDESDLWKSFTSNAIHIPKTEKSMDVDMHTEDPYDSRNAYESPFSSAQLSVIHKVTPAKMSYGEDEYEHEQGMQTGWYAGNGPGGAIFPSYIRQPPQNLYKNGTAIAGVDKTKVPKDAGPVGMRLTVKRLDVSLKWFDGEDWKQRDSTTRAGYSKKDGRGNHRPSLFDAEERERTTEERPERLGKSANKTINVLLGSLLNQDHHDAFAEEDAMARWKESGETVSCWWNSSEFYHVVGNRKVETMVEVRLSDLALRSDGFLPASPYSSSLKVHIHDVELIDHVTSSSLKKLLYHWRSNRLHPRETNSAMMRLSMLAVRTDLTPKTDEETSQTTAPRLSVSVNVDGSGTVTDTSAENEMDKVPDDEMRVCIGLLPLRVNMDQDTACFLTRFMSKAFPDEEAFRREVDATVNDTTAIFGEDALDSEADSGQQPTPEMFFQSLVVSSVKLKIDYHPKRVDIAGLREGNFIELLHVLPMEGLCLMLPCVRANALDGLSAVGEKILSVWINEILEKQLHHIAAGINMPPVRSITNVCNGAADVVLLPLHQYKKGGKVGRAARKGAVSFLRTMTTEALGNAGRLTANMQGILQSTDTWLNKTSKTTSDGKSVFDPSPFADQPANVSEAFSQVANRLSQRATSTARTVVAYPVGQYRRKGIGDAVGSVVRAVPVALLEPMIGGTEALSRVILGARNALDPDFKYEQDQKYKSRSTRKRNKK